MKKTLTLGIIVLGCCLFALAQAGGYYQIPSGSASEYSRDQSRSYKGSSADRFQSYSADDPMAMSANQSAKQKTTVQGCLSQSADGLFMLSDPSGNSYQLNDSSSRLAQLVGKEVRVDGFGLYNSSSSAVPGAISASLATAQQIDVTRVRKIADSCHTRPGSR